MKSDLVLAKRGQTLSSVFDHVLSIRGSVVLTNKYIKKYQQFCENSILL